MRIYFWNKLFLVTAGEQSKSKVTESDDAGTALLTAESRAKVKKLVFIMFISFFFVL